jgi:sugar (pentulose or hexulose) kinase
MVYDSGSKLVKCAIADDNNNLLAIQSWKPEVIKSTDGFQREWNYKNYWRKLLDLTKKTIRSAKIDPRKIKFITSSSIRPSCVFTNDENNALYIGASSELRGIDYADELEDEFYEQTGKSIYESCGHFPSLLIPPSRYKYFQEEKDTDNRITHISQFLPQDSWILVKLGGEVHANIVSAGESGFLDLKTRLWHPAWKDVLELPDYFFPWPVLPGDVVGCVSEEYQEELGLNSETKLVAGLPDTQAALLGGGCIENGSIGAVLGTTTPVQMLTNRLEISPEEDTWHGLMAIKNICDLYYIEANTGMTGQLLTWAAKLFFSDTDHSLKDKFKKLDLAFKHYDEFERMATPEQMRMASVFSFLGPSPLANTQMGITPGIFHFQSPGGVEEITLTKESFITAVFDNIQFAITENIKFLKERIPSMKHSYSIIGGITRNHILLQRFADVLGTSIHTSRSFETTIQGLSVLCDIAAKKIKSLEDYKQKYHNGNILRIYQPRKLMKEKLNSKFSIWTRLFQKYRKFS